MSTNVKSSRVLRLSKTRFPSFSNPANVDGVTGHNSVQTPLTPQANQQTNEKFEHSFTQAVSLKTLMNCESKSMHPMDPGMKVNSKIPKQVIELSAGNTRQASRDSSQTDINVTKPNSKPAYHKRSSNNNIHDLSSITDKLNISNISKASNISNISFTRGSGLSERANIDSERICISNSGVFPKDFPVQSLNDFEESWGSKVSLSSNQNFNHKKSSRTSHGNSYRETLSSNGYQQNIINNSSRTNNENTRHQSGSSGGRTPSGQSISTKSTASTAQTVKNSLQKLETVPLCKVIDLTSGSGCSKETSLDKPFSMGHPILLERSFNRCEMSQISQLLKEQKDQRYVKGLKENNKQSKIKSNQNENENKASPKTLVLTPELAARASNQQAIQILLAEQKGTKDNTRYQGDNSPNFEDSPVKVNQIRACKKPNTNEKGKDDPSTVKQSFKNDLKILADELKSKRDKQSIKKQLLLKKSPLMYNNKQNIVLESAKQKISMQAAKFDLTKDKHDRRARKKRYVEYLSDENIFGAIVDFFCIKTLCLISRVCKQFRTHDMLALIKKAQCRLILKGFNDDEQYDFWDLHANFSYLQKTYPLQFAINGMKPSPFERDIMNDIDRTRFFNDTPMSKQESLVRILLAVSNSVPKIGYVQGMNVLAALFLATKLKDSEVYWLLRYILNKKKFDDILVDGFPRVQLLNYQLDIFARNYIPELVDYLADKGITLGYFATQWFITMFSYDLNFSHLIKIWNFFFIKGWKTLIRVALSLLWHFKDKICKQTLDDLPEFLNSCVKDHIAHISEEELFRVAFSFKISNRLLKGLETLYEHSAPINVVLIPDQAQNRLEWKIISENSHSQSTSMVQKDIIEYLNENLETMKSINRLRGDGHNELANYRSVQIDLCNSSLLVDKSLNSATLRDKSHLDMSTELRSTSKPILSGVKLSKTNENNFFQTLTDFGKKIRQIWVTPKDESLDLSQASKFIGDKILSEQTGKSTFRKGQAPLSERNILTMSSSLLSKDLKTTTTNAEEFVEPMNGKKTLANVLRGPSERDLLSSIQPFSASLFGKDDDQSFNFETRVATMSTSDLFDKVEKEILHAPKRGLSKHRKNTSLTQESQNIIKSFQKPKMEKFGQSARNMNEKSYDNLESSKNLHSLSIEKGFLSHEIKDHQKQGLNIFGNKIKQSRETKPFKEMMKPIKENEKYKNPSK